MEQPAGFRGQDLSVDDASTYIKLPPFFDNMGLEPDETVDIKGAHILAVLGDSVTTDHISPAGSIPKPLMQVFTLLLKM